MSVLLRVMAALFWMVVTLLRVVEALLLLVVTLLRVMKRFLKEKVSLEVLPLRFGIFFTDKGFGEDGIKRAQCKGCGTILKSGGKTHGTNTLWRHKDICKNFKLQDVGQLFFDYEGNVRSKKIEPMVSRELLASAIIQHDLPFSFVEYEGIRKWMKYVSPDSPCISRNTLVSDITKIYLREKQKLKQVLANIKNRVCLTSDIWTACTSEGYICLTGHFVDENWKLNSKILSFTKMPPPHTRVELASKIYEFLKEWGIEKKVFSLTLDNASCNDSMQDILKDQLTLHGSLLCDGDFFHIRCSAHILNLIVQNGLKMVSSDLHKIRESVKYVKGSETRMKKFLECVNAVGNIDTSIGLRLDVSTRWNSTYLMLDSAIRYKKAFTSLQLRDRTYKYYPSNEEWTRGEKICEFLEPFYETTNLISGSSYTTSNHYFMQVWKIESILKENLTSEDQLIRGMCARMFDKFDKYWSSYSVVLAFGAILDPRIKLVTLEHLYEAVERDPLKYQEAMSLVKANLYKLYEQYSSQVTPTIYPSQSSSQVTQSSMQSGGSSKTYGKRAFEAIRSIDSRIVKTSGKSELELYLEEPKLEYAYYEDLDVLNYWKERVHRYPALALMARDVLAIPITTVASESAFSIGARVLTKYRSCTLPEKVQVLMCTRNWLHGYDANEESADEISSQDSNANEHVEEETVNNV